jgi:predicted GIY-YIG superfamily endonuclease
MSRKRVQRDTYNYKLRKGRTVVYGGITNDPSRRKLEHRTNKNFTSMHVDPAPRSRENARRIERDRLETYKRNQSRKPKYNKVI